LNALDYVIIALLAWGFISGFRRGFVMELANIAGIFLGIWLAMKFSGSIRIWLETKQEMAGWWVPYLAFLLVFVAVYVAAFFGGKALTKALKLMMLGIPNRIAGGVFGLFKMLMLSSVLFVFLRAMGAHALSPALENGSFIHEKITTVASYFYPSLESILPEKKPESLLE